MFSYDARKLIKEALIPEDRLLYMGLFVSEPDENGLYGVEVSYPSYERLALEFSEDITGAPMWNTTAGFFNQMDSGFRVQSVSHYGLFDVAGNLIEWGWFADSVDGVAVERPISVSPSRNVFIDAGTIPFGMFLGGVPDE